MTSGPSQFARHDQMIPADEHNLSAGHNSTRDQPLCRIATHPRSKAAVENSKPYLFTTVFQVS